MADAASLHCPNCGAPFDGAQGGPAKPGDQTCTYCHAALATARCASCLGKMGEVRIGDTALMECERCHAIWVDAATFEHICADRAAQAAVLHQWSVAPPRAAGEVRYRKCVACGKVMNRVNFGKRSGTVVDVCRGHGTFLDAGELHLIVTFIQQGGLDRARQREIQDLKEEQERLHAIQVRRETNPGPVHFEMTTRTWTGPDLLKLLEHLKR